MHSYRCCRQLSNCPACAHGSWPCRSGRRTVSRLAHKDWSARHLIAVFSRRYNPYRAKAFCKHRNVCECITCIKWVPVFHYVPLFSRNVLKCVKRSHPRTPPWWAGVSAPSAFCFYRIKHNKQIQAQLLYMVRFSCPRMMRIPTEWTNVDGLKPSQQKLSNVAGVFLKCSRSCTCDSLWLRLAMWLLLWMESQYETQNCKKTEENNSCTARFAGCWSREAVSL